MEKTSNRPASVPFSEFAAFLPQNGLFEAQKIWFSVDPVAV